MIKGSDCRREVWLLTPWQESEVQGINQEQTAVWQTQAVHEKWVGCVLNGHLKTCWICDFTSGTKPAIFLGMTQGAYSFFKTGCPHLLQTEMLGVPLAHRSLRKMVWFFTSLSGLSTICSIFGFLTMGKKYPDEVWNNFTVHVHRYLFMPGFILYFILFNLIIDVLHF